MARYLGLDWDVNQLHVISATAARGGVRVDRAVVVSGDFRPQPGRAEAVGQLLRERLKEAGIAAAPVVLTVGRDRVVLKEIRFPPVPPAEEPALVRFQAAKELTESSDAQVIDYAVKPSVNGSNGEKTALAVAVRREITLFLKEVCRVAGLKPLALTPRGFGVAAALERAAATVATPALPEPDAVAAILTLAEDWADFSVVRGKTLLFTRSLPTAGNLAAEVKRNLALYAGQSRGSAADRIQALYLAGGDEHAALREQLQQTVPVPVHPLDPFAREAQVQVTGDRGGFTGCVGLVAEWAAARKASINLLQPKEPVKTADPERERLLKYALVGILVLAAVGFAGYWLLASAQSTLNDLRAEGTRQTSLLTQLAPDAKQIQALREWHEGNVSWLDELYEITRRFDWQQGFRVTELTAVPRTLPRNAKDKTKQKYVALVTIIGEVPTKQARLVDAFKDALNDAGHRASIKHIGDLTGSAARKGRDVKTFTVSVDVARQTPNRYVERFTPPLPPKQPPPIRIKKQKAPEKAPSKGEPPSIDFDF